MNRPPLIAHIVHHLGIGGLENGLVNLINHMPEERYRHAVVCLKGYSDFRKRIIREDVEIVALNKREGNDLGLHLRLFKTLRRMKPDIVHTRNLATMEEQVIAAVSGVRTRVHGEHGRDTYDLHGKSRKYNLLRKAIRPFISHYVAVSKDLESWLIDTVGVTPTRVRQIYNGVDSVRFHPRNGHRPLIGPAGFLGDDAFVIGSVGRMVAVKDYVSLVRAFLLLLKKEQERHSRLRLVIVGDGDSRQECLNLLRSAGAEALAWLPGERPDIPELMRVMDLFVLPSLGEGISNTVLEAMSSGLPVVATKVGGNTELVEDGVTGTLVPPEAPETLAEAILDYYRKPEIVSSYGRAARKKIDTGFSMDEMAKNYVEVYDKALFRHGMEI